MITWTASVKNINKPTSLLNIEIKGHKLRFYLVPNQWFGLFWTVMLLTH